MQSLLRRLVVGRPQGIRARIRHRLWNALQQMERETSVNQASETKTSTPIAPPMPKVPSGFRAIWRVDALKPGEVTEVVVEGESLAVANVGGAFFISSNICPHAGGPMGDGQLHGFLLTCPYHGWSFDLRDGRCAINAAVTLPIYPVQVVGNEVCVQWPLPT